MGVGLGLDTRGSCLIRVRVRDRVRVRVGVRVRVRYTRQLPAAGRTSTPVVL